MKAWHFAVVAGLGIVLILFYKGLWQDPHDIPTVLIGTPAPAFSGPEVNSGDMISLEQFRGKVVMVNFWASWCYECKVEHESILAIRERYKSNPDFVLLGVNFQDDVGNARDYLKTFGSTFEHVRDLKGEISIGFGVYGVPETFVVDRTGIIRFKHVGPVVGPAFTKVTRDVIEPMLEGRPPATL